MEGPAMTGAAASRSRAPAAGCQRELVVWCLTCAQSAMASDDDNDGGNSDNEAPQQITFAQSQQDAWTREQEQLPVTSIKKRKRKRVRERVPAAAVTKAREEAREEARGEEARRHGTRVQVSLPQRTVELRSGKGSRRGVQDSRLDFKEAMLADRKRVRRRSLSCISRT